MQTLSLSLGFLKYTPFLLKFDYGFLYSIPRHVTFLIVLPSPIIIGARWNAKKAKNCQKTVLILLIIIIGYDEVTSYVWILMGATLLPTPLCYSKEHVAYDQPSNGFYIEISIVDPIYLFVYFIRIYSLLMNDLKNVSV